MFISHQHYLFSRLFAQRLSLWGSFSILCRPAVTQFYRGHPTPRLRGNASAATTGNHSAVPGCQSLLVLVPVHGTSVPPMSGRGVFLSMERERVGGQGSERDGQHCGLEFWVYKRGSNKLPTNTRTGNKHLHTQVHIQGPYVHTWKW